MNYRSILIVCLATLGLAVAGWGQADGKIAFISYREGYFDVWIMNADGSDPVNLTNGRHCASPAWSPDGAKIAYIGDILDDDPYGGEIWLMDADGGNPQQVTDDSIEKLRLSWSVDGNRIYYDGWTGDPQDSADTFVMALDGSGSSPVDWREAPHLRYRHFGTPSPDGTKYAEVWLRKEGDEEGLVRLVIDDAIETENERPIIPLPDVPGLDLCGTDQSDHECVSRNATYMADLTWSPNSMRVAFSTWLDGGLIWAVDIDGDNLVELTNGLGGREPSWQLTIPTATSIEARSWGRIKSPLSIGTH